MNRAARISTPEVLDLAGYSRATLRARQEAGRMPPPVDRGKHGFIYDRAAVLKALGMDHDDAPAAPSWHCDPDALREHFARPVRRPQAPG